MGAPAIRRSTFDVRRPVSYGEVVESANVDTSFPLITTIHPETAGINPDGSLPRVFSQFIVLMGANSKEQNAENFGVLNENGREMAGSGEPDASASGWEPGWAER
jgi:hypothetical protein